MAGVYVIERWEVVADQTACHLLLAVSDTKKSAATWISKYLKTYARKHWRRWPGCKSREYRDFLAPKLMEERQRCRVRWVAFNRYSLKE